MFRQVMLCSYFPLKDFFFEFMVQYLYIVDKFCRQFIALLSIPNLQNDINHKIMVIPAESYLS